jgi:putative tricarboxylic transport membrane protein
MIEAFIQGLINCARPDVALGIFAATILAVIAGVIPAISGSLVVILIVPFVWAFDPLLALPIMCSLIAVSCMGGSLTAILIGVPGDNPNAATVLDGFPMTHKGQGGRALGLAITSNMLGGIFAVVLAFIMIPIMVPIIMAFRSPELCLMIVLALLFISALTKESKIKGLISGLLGMLLACIGFQPATGLGRLNFGNLYLYGGLHSVTIMLGMLAVPIMFQLNKTCKTIAPPDMKSAGNLSEIIKGGLEVVRDHKLLWLRSVISGYIVGIMPALGATVGSWAAYGQAKKTSKHPELFGTGNPEGIVAPESASNACHAGDLLTTLAFGIPGSGIMVILLAAFIMLGIQPGPKMLVEHTALCFTMLISVAIANLIAGAICIFGSTFLIKVTRISFAYIFAFVIPIVVLSVYVARGYMIDVYVLAIISFLGVFMDKWGYSAPALILGFVLGDQFEYYLINSVTMYGYLFFLSPICLVLIFLGSLMMGYEPLKGLIVRVRTKRRMGGAE